MHKVNQFQLNTKANYTFGGTAKSQLPERLNNVEEKIVSHTKKPSYLVSKITKGFLALSVIFIGSSGCKKEMQGSESQQLTSLQRDVKYMAERTMGMAPSGPNEMPDSTFYGKTLNGVKSKVGAKFNQYSKDTIEVKLTNINDTTNLRNYDTRKFFYDKNGNLASKNYFSLNHDGLGKFDNNSSFTPAQGVIRESFNDMLINQYKKTEKVGESIIMDYQGKPTGVIKSIFNSFKKTISHLLCK